MVAINKTTLERLAELARIELDGRSEEKLLKDFGEILGHFEELQGLDTEGVEPMAGPVKLRHGASGTHLRSIAREDEPERTPDTGKGKEQFPEVEGEFLKIPPVF